MAEKIGKENNKSLEILSNALGTTTSFIFDKSKPMMMASGYKRKVEQIRDGVSGSTIFTVTDLKGGHSTDADEVARAGGLNFTDTAGNVILKAVQKGTILRLYAGDLLIGSADAEPYAVPDIKTKDTKGQILKMGMGSLTSGADHVIEQEGKNGQKLATIKCNMVKKMLKVSTVEGLETQTKVLILLMVHLLFIDYYPVDVVQSMCSLM